MLRAAGRGAHRRRGDAAGAVLGDDHASRAGGAGGAQHRAQVLRVLDVVEEDDERVLLVSRGGDDLVERHVGIAGDLQRHALVVAEAHQPVEPVAVHRPHRDPPRVGLVADAGELVVVVRRRWEHDLRRLAPAGGERLLHRVAAVDPLAAADLLARSAEVAGPVLTPVRRAHASASASGAAPPFAPGRPPRGRAFRNILSGAPSSPKRARIIRSR